MSILIAILIFSVIVVIHELGHFTLAKANKIGVIEFSLGMGPRIVTWIKTEEGIKVHFFISTKKLESEEKYEGRTWYSIKCLPIGGSCMMLGEEEAVESDLAFNKKSVYARMSVIFAGPFFNFVLAFLLSLIIIGAIGYDPAVITEVRSSQPMEEAGFKKDDVITKIDGESIVINREISAHFQFNRLNGEPVEITVKRDGEKISSTVTPRIVKLENGKEAYQLGFTYGAPRQKVNALETIKYSAYEVKYWIWTTVKSLGEIFKGKVSKDDIAGPVGIVSLVSTSMDEAESPSMAALTALSIAILLTANLGIMNLLPIPALDGGRLLLLIVEWIRRKPNNQKFETYINFAGFAVLMLLMVFIIFNDIMKLF